jgi:hypothetical protein
LEARPTIEKECRPFERSTSTVTIDDFNKWTCDV